MGSLKEDHSYLYKRVRLKAILHIALGLCLIFLPSTAPTNTNQGEVTQFVQSALSFFGAVYLLIGVLIAVGLYRSRQTYIFLRKVMTAAALYNTLWSLLLFAIIIDKPNRGTAYISVIYWYMTYNIWYVRNDPGWRAIEIVKRIRDDKPSDQ